MSLLRYAIPIVWICLFATPYASGQIGILGQMHLPGLIGESASAPDPVIRSSWSAGLVYTFRNPRMRTEWVTGISYGQLALDGQNSSGQNRIFSAGVDFRIYPMDLYGDCMCPTFSRKGDVFQKGFFWEAGLGGQSMQLQPEPVEGWWHSFYGRLGMGLDIGLSRHLTITPGVRIQYNHRYHPWGSDQEETGHRPVWILPFLQGMIYFRD